MNALTTWLLRAITFNVLSVSVLMNLKSLLCSVEQLCKRYKIQPAFRTFSWVMSSTSVFFHMQASFFHGLVECSSNLAAGQKKDHNMLFSKRPLWRADFSRTSRTKSLTFVFKLFCKCIKGMLLKSWETSEIQVDHLVPFLKKDMGTCFFLEKFWD